MKTLNGEKVSLRPIDSGDTLDMVRWRNSSHVKPMLFSQEDLTPEQHEQWLQKKVRTGECAQFIIVENENNVPIGTTFLKNIDRTRNTAEFGIFIGELPYLGKKLGAEATRLVVEYGFAHEDFAEIYLYVLENNTAAIAIYKKIGFVLSEVNPRGYIRNGTAYPVYKMKISRKNT
jgi:RimJ/RimL family protein N-acetyltransferase